MFPRIRLITLLTSLSLYSFSTLSAAPAKNNAKKKQKSTEALLKETRSEVETVQRGLFARRRQIMTESEEIRRLRSQIAELEGKVNEILVEDEEYAGLERRRQRLRDELSELYRQRATEMREEKQNTAAQTKAPAPPPLPKRAKSPNPKKEKTSTPKKDKK